MVTNYPQQLATTESAHAESTTTGVMSRMASRLSQTICGLTGHDGMVHFEGKRVLMRCTSCGHESPGWEVNERGPRQRFEGDAKRLRMASQPHLVVLRKSA